MVILMPKISVIIPTYNRSGMVKEAISSVLAQTEHDLEVIVVDDGSTDNTRSVIESLNDHRVRYFYKTNGGPASARNFGLSKARCQFIAFLDSDDLWPTNYLDVMVANLENNQDFGVAYSPITLVYRDGSRIKSYKRPEGKSGWITLDLFKSSFIWIFAAVFRRSVWKDFYFDEQLNKTSEDSDVLLRLSLCTQFLFIPQVETFHRISTDSISAQTGVDCTRLLALERFYFALGGDKIVPPKIAGRRLSHAVRKVAEHQRKKGAKIAALKLYKYAIRYWPYDVRLYWGWLKTSLLNVDNDPEPTWKMPEPLGEPIGANRFS
jgi:glycosyltransferase involved in cell wall biosynthesis